MDIELLATTRVGSASNPKNLEVTGAITAQAVTVGGRAVVVDNDSRLTIWDGSIGTAQLADHCITNLKVALDAGISMSKIQGLTEALADKVSRTTSVSKPVSSNVGGIYMGYEPDGISYGIEVCSAVGGQTYIDLSTVGNDFTARIQGNRSTGDCLMFCPN